MKIKRYFFIKLLAFSALSFLAVFFAGIIFAISVNAMDLTGGGFIIRDPIIGTGGGYGTSAGFKLFSAGHTSFSDIGGTSASFKGRYGFLYYPFVSAAVLTATPNGADADLSWSASVAGLGWTVDGYNTGKATVPGGPYTYTDVGNVVIYTYDNLAPGDYCFVVQTYDTLGYVITTSNEDCLTIQPTITFDLDTSVADAETDPAYTVALGAITTTDTRVSGSDDSVEMIIVEGESNAPGGVVVTVRNTNGLNGLVSTSVPGDDIGSADGTMVDGTENYGLCVITVGLVGFARASPYNSGACATNSETNAIQGLTATGENILNSGDTPLPTGHAEISVNGAISPITPAHPDYADTLTFIATGTF